jgi:hypothetical protein
MQLVAEGGVRRLKRLAVESMCVEHRNLHRACLARTSSSAATRFLSWPHVITSRIT